jgi:hypothetical protein
MMAPTTDRGEEGGNERLSVASRLDGHDPRAAGDL